MDNGKYERENKLVKKVYVGISTFTYQK